MKSECIEMDTDSSLEGGGSLAASLEQKKEEGNGRLAQYCQFSRRTGVPPNAVNLVTSRVLRVACGKTSTEGTEIH